MFDRFTRRRHSAPLLIIPLLAAFILGCAAGEQARPQRIILASTTSTEDSGLFEELIPAFEAAHPEYSVQVIAVGTGEALELGRRTDADVLLVHSPAAEEAFVAEGYGTERREVMYNDYIIVGPADDPAGVRDLDDVVEALKKITDAGVTFVSRGDDSGTHKKELELWNLAGIDPDPETYLNAGQGMGEVLRVTNERQGYTLTDRATYLFLLQILDLEILVEGDERLFNQYGVIPVVGARSDTGARAFADWITSPEAQAFIANYGVDRFGKPLFTPNASQSAKGS